MKNYVMMLVGASLLTGMLGVICPRKHQKYLRLLCGFCMIAILVAPLPTCFDALGDRLSSVEGEIGEEDAKNYEEIYHKALGDANQKQLESWLQTRFVQTYSLDQEDLSVSVVLTQEGENVSVKKTIVFLSGGAILVDPGEMISFVEETLSCPCEIVYGNAEKSY